MCQGEMFGHGLVPLSSGKAKHETVVGGKRKGGAGEFRIWLR